MERLPPHPRSPRARSRPVVAGRSPPPPHRPRRPGRGARRGPGAHRLRRHARRGGGENRRLRMMIPNSPGGGYDQTGRAATRVMETADLTGRFEVTNVIGASGTVAMQRLVNERGAEDLLMTMGLGVVGATYTNGSEARVSGATPIAQLIEDYEGLIVPARLAVPDGRGPRRRVARRPGQRAHRRRVEPRRAGPPVPDAARGRGRRRPDRGQLHRLRRRRAADHRAARRQDRRRHVGARRVRGPDRRRLAARARRLRRGAARRRRRPDARGVRHRPRLHQLAGRPRAARHPRRGPRPAHRAARGDARHGAWQEALETNGWVDAFRTGDEFEEFLVEQDERVAGTLEELGLL